MKTRNPAIATIAQLLSELEDGSVRWENNDLYGYLEALAGWLQDYPGYYSNIGQPVPTDGWEIVALALKAATTYE